MQNTTQHIAIFASGNGTNADAVIQYFKESTAIRVALIISNKADVGVHEVAKKHGIPSVYLSKNEINDSTVLLPILAQNNINWIVLAGFLLLVPAYLIQQFENKIINIHPALLPKFGGKGMYGSNVHKAVFEAKESKSGITIHLVNEEYDKGAILAQKTVAIEATDTPELIAKKVQKLEHQHFPKVIEETIENSLVINQK